jgi:hypothetical protein
VRNETRTGREEQHGQIMVLFVIMIVFIMGVTALVIDVGVLRRTSGVLAGAVDSAALAGGAQLPATSAKDAAIRSSVLGYLQSNDPTLQATDGWITYRCLVGLTPAGLPNGSQIPGVCDPGTPANTTLTCTTAGGPWRCGNGVAAVACVATGTNKCNVIVVGGDQTVDYGFGRVVGVNSGSTGTVQSAACFGACGGPPSVPLDMVLIIDRTTSMTNADLAKAETAARSILKLFDPSVQRVGLGVLPQSNTGAASLSTAMTAATSPGGYACRAGAYSVPVTSTAVGGALNGTWSPVTYPAPALPGSALSSNYQTSSGVLDETSQLVNTINCLKQAAGTDQGDAVAAATSILNTYQRTVNGEAVKRAIILLSDGKPQRGSGTDNGTDPFSCKYASNKAILAKAAGIEIYTIGFGVVTTDGCPETTNNLDTAGKNWKGESAVDLLANMATASSGALGCPGTGTLNSNTDGDHFFCLPKDGDLSATFGQVIQALSAGAHLVSLP